MSVPDVTVRAAFGSDALAASPTWTDVSAYVLSVDISMGRSADTGAFGAGTASVLFDNSDRRFDPTHGTGPYSSGGVSQLIPNVRVEVTAEHSGTHHLATVWADSWTAQHSAENATCEMVGTDGTKFLGREDLVELSSESYRLDKPGTRIGRVLDVAGWPAGLRSLDTGSTELAGTLFGEPARTHIDRVAYAERGVFFFGPDGSATFVGRHDQFTDTNRITAAETFSDDSAHTGPRWSQIAPLVIDETELANYITVSREGGVAQTAENATSISTYGRVTGEEVTDALVLDDIEALSVADFYLGLHDTPFVRVDSVTLIVIDDASSEYEHAVERQLRERIEVEVLPPGGGVLYAQDSFIESIGHSIQAGSWVTTWGLSDTDRYGFTDADEWLLVGTTENQSKVGTGKVAP